MRNLLLAASLALAQTTSGTVIAVTIDAAVVDAQKRPIAGLAAGDFTVELDGRSQRIVAVTYYPSGTPMAGAIGPVFDAVTGERPVYRLVVQPPDGAAAGQEFTVALTVKRTSAKVDAPTRIAAAPVTVTGTLTTPAAAADAPVADRLRTTIATGRTERGLPLALGRAVRRGTDPSKVMLDVQIVIAASAKPPIDALVGLVDARGALRTANAQMEAAANGSFRADLSLPIDAGPYTLRVAAADAAGAMAALASKVNAQLTAMDTLVASDLLRWTEDAGHRRPLLVDEVPAGASAVGVTLELYPAPGAAPPGDLLVKMVLAADAATGSPLIERIVTPEGREGGLAAEAEFPLDRIQAGTYTVTATVLSGTRVIGKIYLPLAKR